MASAKTNEIVIDISPVIRVYKDGTVERMLGSAYVPPSLPQDQATGVSSKDFKISSEVSARLYFPNIKHLSQEKLPVLVYFHGGGLVAESAFSSVHHHYINLLSAEAKALVVSVEYRLAPEHPLPVAYEDCWAALQCVASHVLENPGFKKEPWLINHGNFDKLYIGGDSAGANIVHNIAMRAGAESLNGGLKILGAFLSQPYFLGSDCDSSRKEFSMLSRMWALAYPSAPGGIDNPMINPMAEHAPSLSGLGCSRLLVTLAEKDFLHQKGILYAEAVKKSGWKGELQLVESKGEDHGLHVFNPDTEKAKIQIKQFASFLTQDTS